MCQVTLLKYSPLYEAYADDANKVEEAIEFAITFSANKLGAEVAKLFSLTDKREEQKARLAA
jgi:hypothetical protein